MSPPAGPATAWYGECSPLVRITPEPAGAQRGHRSSAWVTQAYAEQSGRALERIASAAYEQAKIVREVDRGLVCIRDLSLRSASGADQVRASRHELVRLLGNWIGWRRDSASKNNAHWSDT